MGYTKAFFFSGFSFESGPNRHGNWVCDFAYVRVHRRTGKHRVLEEEEIKRYASEG